MKDYSNAIYDLVKELRIEHSSNVELNNLGLLVSAQKDEGFDQFMVDLRVHLDQLKANYKADKATLCLLMLCCEGYSINHKSVPMYTDNEIHALWRAISSCVSSNVMMQKYVPALLIDDRTASHFEIWFLTNRNNYAETKHMNKNHFKLSKRNEELRCVGRVESVGDLGNLVMSRGYSCHVSYAELILLLCNYTDGHIGRWNSRPRCSCKNTRECITVESNEKCMVCSIHGASGNCKYILLQDRGVSILFRSTQCVYMTRHLDRFFPLPLQIQLQIK